MTQWNKLKLLYVGFHMYLLILSMYECIYRHFSALLLWNQCKMFFWVKYVYTMTKTHLAIVLASNTFGCFLDALFTKWTPCFICKTYARVLEVEQFFFKECQILAYTLHLTIHQQMLSLPVWPTVQPWTSLVVFSFCVFQSLLVSFVSSSVHI